LDSQDDVLVNVNLLDDERYKKNNEVKKQRPGYQPFEDEEIDELTGLPKTRSLLAKYDVEIDGEQKTSFVIGMVFLHLFHFKCVINFVIGFRWGQ
jgi:U4/U6.U5 tri-snRNP-associated protein 1